MTSEALLLPPPLDYRVELPVLGLRTRFETNSIDVHAQIEQSFGGWRAVAGNIAAGGDAPFRVAIVVQEGSEPQTERGDSPSSAAHATVRHIAPDPERLIVHSAGSVAVCDPARRTSVAYVTTALVADRCHFRGAMLEAITLALLSHFDRHPIHAAAVGRGGEALLLVGRSGAGKSTLAYAAHRAGLDVLGEDRVWIQLGPPLCVWGWPGDVRLRPGAEAAFPEALSSPLERDEDGRLRLALPDDAAGGEWAPAARYLAGDARVCLLNGSRNGDPELTPATPDELRAGLLRDVAPGFDRFPDRHRAVVEALVARRGWRLSLSPDPRQAVPLLERILSDRMG